MTLLLALAFLPAYSPDGPGPAADREARALVEALGLPCYRCRERAEKRLAAMGRRAQRHLDRAARHRDPEVRMRAWRLTGGRDRICPVCTGERRCPWMAGDRGHCRLCTVAGDRHDGAPCWTCKGIGRVDVSGATGSID